MSLRRLASGQVGAIMGGGTPIVCVRPRGPRDPQAKEVTVSFLNS